MDKLSLKNDAALSRALEVAPPVISKIRHRKLSVGASMLIRMHEISELSIKELRILMGDRRDKFRSIILFLKTRKFDDAAPDRDFRDGYVAVRAALLRRRSASARIMYLHYWAA